MSDDKQVTLHPAHEAVVAAYDKAQADASAAGLTETHLHAYIFTAMMEAFRHHFGTKSEAVESAADDQLKQAPPGTVTLEFTDPPVHDADPNAPKEPS